MTAAQVVFGLAAVVLTQGVVAAAEISSGPLTAVAPGERLTCYVVNVGDKDVAEVTVELVSPTGILLGSETATDLPPPGGVFVNASFPGGEGFCRARISGGKRGVRGTLFVRNAGGSVAASVPLL